MSETDTQDEIEPGMLLSPREIEGIDSIEIGGDEEGFQLFIERDDGSGVAVRITPEEREALERNFMIKD